MSIYKQNIDPIALTEGDADEFLRDMGITLYEDTIMIEGTIYEGSYGEAILESNGIFLYEDGIVLEGKQADEYRARKKQDKFENIKNDIERIEHRGHVNRSRGKSPDTKTRIRKANAIVDYECKKRSDAVVKAMDSDYGPDYQKNLTNARKYSRNMLGKMTSASDAADRHMRRHPKQYAKPKNESTIFSDIEII